MAIAPATVSSAHAGVDIPRPRDVGILAMEVYFPHRCISEADLEVFDGVSTGKYTIGLGQEYMACCDDREDINSFALNAIHGNHMTNMYDFYKPRLDSEYPEVDGPVSVTTYISALDAAYARFREKTAKAKKLQLNGSATNGSANGKAESKASFSLEDVDYAVFHSPYGKQVQKAFGRLFYNDFVASPSSPQFANVPSPETILNTTYNASLTDKNLEKTFIAASKALYATKVGPSMHCSKRLGNMYTASLYGCLASLLSSVEPSALQGKRVSMFAFGSGCAASFFTLHVKGDTSEIREKMNLLERLKSMKVVPCQEYVDALSLREKNHNAVNYVPEGSIENIWPGAYYLESIDGKFRRKYARAPKV
ncbi:hypothetical protein ID866_4727 [Astraeus odoratus]|nr:hypothetical protein ID866_4727 [Astraeus odoratus]